MKKLLSLPPNLVHQIHQLEELSLDEWFCTSDPLDAKLGSGGGTTWLLEQCRAEEGNQEDFVDWLGKEKRILLHAGGQSSRLPAYAPAGKILTPIPVFRWERGQYLQQKLLDLQLPLYEKIMEKAPAGLHTLVASGDVYLRSQGELGAIPQVDVVCYGLWVDPSLATHHGVFAARNESPDQLDFMLQKPALEELEQLSSSHLFLMDIGVWLLSDRAVEVLRERSYTANGERTYYDLYAQFGLGLGENPRITDPAVNALSVAILPLPQGEFYHYGTSRELLSSTLALQNKEVDQRKILHKKIKPHPAIFVQNAQVDLKLCSTHSHVWIENAHIGKQWKLENHHILTGIPTNDWSLRLTENQCIDLVPMGKEEWGVRPYGYFDTFKGSMQEADYLMQSFASWMDKRGVSTADFKYATATDLQQVDLFPVVSSLEEVEAVLNWMLHGANEEGKAIWCAARRLSAEEILAEANLERLYAQRSQFYQQSLTALAANYDKSVFYQSDLLKLKTDYQRFDLPLPAALPKTASPLLQMHNAQFRSVLVAPDQQQKESARAYRVMQEALTESLGGKAAQPQMGVYSDQIVWARSPVRIDVAGGWTDTPPYSIYEGGSVINLAIELNGQPPIQVYVKPRMEKNIVLHSIDLGATERVDTYDELRRFNVVGSPFSIPKAALHLAGFHGEQGYASLAQQLGDLGCGLEITLLAAIPAGSGLGTSSVLAATVLGALNDFAALGWSRSEIGFYTLIVEQMLTTGGGWQDQYGGLFHGVKRIETNRGFRQLPVISWLPDHLFTQPEYSPCHLLYYTGITRTAKSILGEIVQGMFLNSKRHLAILEEMKYQVADMADAIQKGNWEQYGHLVAKTWEQKKALDSGTNPPEIDRLIDRVKDYCLGYTLPGAGGGGYLYMVAKSPEAALQIRQLLEANAPNPRARFVTLGLSSTGLQISRS